MRQAKWIASRGAAMESAAANNVDVSKQNLLVNIKFLLKIILLLSPLSRRGKSWFGLWDVEHESFSLKLKTPSPVTSSEVMMLLGSDFFGVSWLWPLHVYCHHSGRLGPVVAWIQIRLDLWSHGLCFLFPNGEWGIVVWVNARDVSVATPSLVIWRAGEGSVTGYLIEADGDFHRMHRRSRDGLPGGPIINAAP